MTDQDIERLALEWHPNPSHDTHWERERVKFLRMGFTEGAKAMRERLKCNHEEVTLATKAAKCNDCGTVFETK